MNRNHVVKLFYLTPLLLFPNGLLKAQGLQVLSGAAITVNGNANIVINDGHYLQNGDFSPGTGNVKFTGSQQSNISGTGNIMFNDLTVDKSASNVVLNNDITVSGNLNMNNRHIDLNNNDIELGNTGTIVGENNNSYVTGLLGGTIGRTETMNAPTAVNPGNIGVEITTGANLGSTRILRGHVQQQGVASGIGIARYFNIIPAAGSNVGLNATLNFHYLEDELMGIGEADLAMSVKTAPMGWWAMIGEDGLDVTNNVLTKNGIDTLGLTTLSNELNNPLPITLLAFNGRLLNGQTMVNWDVANEEGISSYDIERSADGKGFTKLASQNAKGVKGEQKVSYNQLDPAPFKGNTFYRLKVHEQSGNSYYSKIIRVELGDAMTLSVYPNPVTDKVIVDFSAAESKTLTFRLLDVHGKVIEVKEVKASAGMNRVEWNTSALAAATYYLDLNGINQSPIKISKL